MTKKIISLITLLSLIINLVGCYTYRQVPDERVEKYQGGYTITKVVTLDGEVVNFLSLPWKPVLTDSTIEGWSEGDEWVSVSRDQVLAIYLKKYDLATIPQIVIVTSLEVLIISVIVAVLIFSGY
jgi:hypothetical protein